MMIGMDRDGFPSNIVGKYLGYLGVASNHQVDGKKYEKSG
jgi:hypothetical protein